MNNSDPTIIDFEQIKEKKAQAEARANEILKEEPNEIPDGMMQLGCEGLINDLCGIKDNSFRGRRAAIEAEKLREILLNIDLT